MDRKIIEYEGDTNCADIAMEEKQKQKEVESVIQKWLILQKTIKEEITLEDVIIRHQQNEFVQLKDYFKQYYIKKLESRKVLEEIKRLQDDRTDKVREIFIERELEHIFLDICEPIKNLLFLFRNNYDYIVTLVSLISEDDDEDQISSLVELFCNQFYENILIPNPEQEELLLLVYKLLEREISPMNSASIDEFLNDDTFLGKFISSFLKRQEFKVFLTTLINPFIRDIENNNSDNYIGMSLFAIKDFLKEKNKNETEKLINIENSTDFDDWEDMKKFLFKNIPKTSISFKKRNKKAEKIEEEKDIKKDNENLDEEEDEEEDEDFESDEENLEEMIETCRQSIINDNDNEKENKDDEINNEYENMLNLNYLNNKTNKETNKVLKNFYSYELEQITRDPDIYSNAGLLEIMKENDFKENRKEIIKKYKDNFIFITKKIDKLIQSLINKIDIIPYSVRCICKIISILLKQKFPSLFYYLRNSFIGKFIFEKCIFPVLSLENKNILEPRILSINTKNCLDEIICVLQNANKCLLFNYNLDTEKTIFNHYLIEIIPLLNKFYEKLIDIELPKVLDDLVTKTKLNIEENIGNKIHNFRKKKKNLQQTPDPKKSKLIPNEKEILYNYFQQHSDEILHLQCICFSIDDILYILNLIGRNIQAFSGLPNFGFFQRTYEFIQPSDYKLDKENSKNPDQNKFFIIFKDEKNSNLETLIKKKKKNTSTFISGDEDSDLIFQRFKYCIKTILKGLNLLNSKDYAHLNMAYNTKKFFTALKHTLDDFGEFSEAKNKIPLKWYGQYLFNNREGLEDKYKFNDYSKLYDDIYNEELNKLNELKSLSSVIITRDGMNIRCAEKILQKAKYDLYHINQAKEFVKIEKFVKEEEIEVCIQTPEIINNKEKDSKKKKLNKNTRKEDNNKLPLFITDDLNCPHKNEKKSPYHAYSITDFISKFSECPWKEGKEKSFVKPKNLVLEDIRGGKMNNKINESIQIYIDIIKKYIKDPKKNIELFNNEDDKCDAIAEKIRDYLMSKLYDYIYPKEPLVDDLIFYGQTKKLMWLKPEHLDIKKIYINQLNSAIMWIKRIDVVKSVLEKLLCISNALNTMNNTIKFSSGKDEDAGQDELVPIFNYIIIKAQPLRMISNMNYIKCFLNNKDNNGNLGFLLSQMESAINFILNINHKCLNITEDEFYKNMDIKKLTIK